MSAYAMETTCPPVAFPTLGAPAQAGELSIAIAVATGVVVADSDNMFMYTCVCTSLSLYIYIYTHMYIEREREMCLFIVCYLLYIFTQAPQRPSGAAWGS